MNKICLLSLVAVTSLFAANIKFNEVPSSVKRVYPVDETAVLSYYDSIKSAKLSVVNISTTKTISGSIGGLEEMFSDPFFKEFFGFRGFNLPKQKQKSTSLGSGVIVSQDGYIVTNNHVIEDADEISVTLSESDKEYKAKLIGADPKTDLAVIKIEAKNLPAILIADSSKVLEGDVVFAIGNPFGVGESITKGIISALNKDNIGINQYENFIQTDASINPGNSGGALVDSRGALVGINTAILSRSGGNNGIGFAIPSNMVKQISSRLISDGKIERGYIGVMIGSLNSNQKEVYKNKEGALITGVEIGTPAADAGLKRGDLVISVDDIAVKNANDLKNIIGSKAPNSTVKIKFERSGIVQSVSIKLAVMSSDKAILSSSNSPIEGLSIVTLTDELRAKYRISENIVGVVVTGVKEKSKAESFGFELGDVILQVGEDLVKDMDSFVKSMKKNMNKNTLVWVNRKGTIQGLVVK